MSAAEWTEVEFGRDRVRYRRRPGYEDADSGYAFVVERWHGERWREVVNASSRDLFALGFKAGLAQAGEGVQGDLFG